MARDRLDNRRVVEEHAAPAPPPPSRAGARGDDLTLYFSAFALVFVAGFAVMAVVLLSRRRRKT